MYLKTNKSHSKPIFWSAPSSAFSGKLRGFIAKAGLDVEERFAHEPRFHQEIVPLIGYFVIPVFELEDGTILQDTTETILYFENKASAQIQRSLIPKTALLNATAHLLNFLGTDGFHKPGMHYRWTYEGRQEAFLDNAFAEWVAPVTGTTRKQQTAKFTSDYLPALGIVKETVDVIEQAWVECLGVLNRHFSVHPYLLGAVPTVADCGLMTMLWAHLARDPVPAYLMRTQAPMVSRWAERMVRPGLFDGSFPNVNSSLDDDRLPETLIPFLKYLFSRVVPETIASVQAFNRMVEQNPGLGSGDYLDDNNSNNLSAHPTCGQIEYNLLGTRITRSAFVDTAFQFQTFARAVQNLGEEDRARFQSEMAAHGGTDLLTLSLARPIDYHNYRYRLA
ncbi:hypothetical protein F5884DRAFT_902234 [Xylogone sp. PMI_703]|nr:hypothetical protein F5884DRAFT_902234 [Xylogone sp. PMI_703]